jgi:hypothetical protein
MEQQIKTLFESGNYELAFILADGQGIDISECGIDFNRIARWKEFNYHASIQIAQGYELSVAAGALAKSTPSSHGFSSFEIAIITKKPMSLDAISKIGLHCSNAQQETGGGECMYIFNYMTNKNIIKIIKIIREYAI